MRLLPFVLLAACSAPPSVVVDMGADLPPKPPDLSTPAPCVAGEFCQTGNGNGICGAAGCGHCLLDTDCSAIDGTTLCIAGACIVAECRSAVDCNGRACQSGRCAGCHSDSECAAANTRCNTVTGRCVTSACTVAPGAQCAASTDLCCSGFCHPVDCCTATECGTDEVCIQGSCLPSSTTCLAPLANLRHVDLDATTDGTGSVACPYNDLGRALDDFKGNAVCTSGSHCRIFVTGVEHASAATRNIPVNVDLTGADDSFAACTVDTCPDESKWPIIDVDNAHHGLQVTGAGDRSVDFFRVNGTGNTNFDGLSVTGNAHVVLDHFRAAHFHDGIMVGGAAADVRAGTAIHGNDYGLVAVAGSTVTVTAAMGDDTIAIYDNGINGIFVSATANFTLSGPLTTPRSITTNHNGGAGVRFFSSDRTVHVDGSVGPLIDGLDVDTNGMDPANDQAGMLIYGDSQLRLRNTRIFGSAGNGVHIVDNGMDSLAGLDFGTASAGGNNTFQGNVLANICFELSTAPPSSGRILEARGNVFVDTDTGSPVTHDCTSSGGSLTHSGGGCGVAGRDIEQKASTTVLDVDVAGCGVTLP